MKHLQLLFTFFSLMALSFSASAQCTPDPGPPSNLLAIYPDTLVDGNVGDPYSHVSTVVFIQDTMIGFPPLVPPFSLDFCNFQITDIPNLPAGLSYVCNKPNCIFEIDHTSGADNRGCIIITGTPTEDISDDTLEVEITIGPGTWNADSMRCEPLDAVTLALIQPFLIQTYRVQFHITGGVNAIEDQLSSEALNLKLFPNPASQQATLKYDLDQTENVEITLLDLTGRTLTTAFSGQQMPGVQQISIPTSKLEDGLYLVRVRFLDRKKSLVEKLSVRKY